MGALARIRKAARVLLTMDEKDPKRLFEGSALLRRLLRLGVLDETKQNLEYILALKPADFMERRLQTQVFKLGLAKSIHHARVLIRHRHIRVGKQIVNIPSFMVRVDSQKHIDFAVTSPYGGGRPGRNRRGGGCLDKEWFRPSMLCVGVLSALRQEGLQKPLLPQHATWAAALFTFACICHSLSACDRGARTLHGNVNVMSSWQRCTENAVVSRAPVSKSSAIAVN